MFPLAASITNAVCGARANLALGDSHVNKIKMQQIRLCLQMNLCMRELTFILQLAVN